MFLYTSVIKNNNKRVIPNRLKPQAEKIIAEEQACFRAGRSTTEQSRSSTYEPSVRNICSTSKTSKLQEGIRQGLALWATMKKYKISTNLIRVTKNLYKAISTVLFNSSIGDWFRTTVGVRQGCILSPTLFSILLERIMTDAS